MARTRTLAQVRNDARALADQVNSTFVTDAQANVWVNQGIAELQDMLIAVDPDRYYFTYSLATTAGTRNYVLPADFYQMRAVDKVIGTDRITIEPYKLQEKNKYRSGWISLPTDGFGSVRYRIMGTPGRIYFEPDPGTGTYELHYVPAPQILANDADTIDGFAGWEDWIVYDTAIRMMIREESDPSALMAERARIEQRIKQMSALRDAGRAPRIADVRSIPSFVPRAR